MIESIAFSPDGKKLASGAQGPTIFQGATKSHPRLTIVLSEAKVWNLENGRLIKSLAGERGRTLSIAFSPDGRLLARCDHVSLIWEALEGGQRSWTKYSASSDPAIGGGIEK